MEATVSVWSEPQADTMSRSPTPTLHDSDSHTHIPHYSSRSMSPHLTLNEKETAVLNNSSYDMEAAICSRCRHDTVSENEGRYNDKRDISQDSSKLVTWDGDDDPERPMNMPRWRKWAIAVTSGLMTFCVTFGSSVFSTTIFVTAKEFGVSSEVMILGVSLFVLGFAVGPMIWGPLSEVYGRTRPMFIGMILFLIFQIPVAVARNLETIFLCRFLAGVFGSAPLAIIAGMYVDFFNPMDRGVATAVFASGVMAGPAMGPILGSFITYSHLGWRWTAWITLIMTALFTTLTWLVTPETCEPVLLAWKAQRLRHESQDWSLHSKSEEQKLDMQTLVSKYLTKPLVMIAKEPILMILTLYISLVYGILYLTFEAYPISFAEHRHWTPQLASLPFLGILIGVVIACFSIALFTKTWYTTQFRKAGKPIPEHRIPMMFAGSIILPIGLFWFAWTSNPAIHWAPQVISGIFIGCGIVLVFMSSVVYMIDVYMMSANSAMAINTFVRSIFGAVFPLFATYMYNGMGVAWASSLLGFVCVALIPFPIIFWFYGKKIRNLSRFAPSP